MDKPLVYQLFCQEHSWVAMFGLDKRWKHLSVKPTPRWDFPLLIRALEDYQLIGRACKCRNAFSLPVLMPEDLTTSYVISLQVEFNTCFMRGFFRFLLFRYLFSMQSWGYKTLNHSGGYYREATPVPIPNTEVKLTGVDNTWLATAREDRLLPDYTSPFALNAEGLFLWFWNKNVILQFTRFLLLVKLIQ